MFVVTISIVIVVKKIMIFMVIIKITLILCILTLNYSRISTCKWDLPARHHAHTLMEVRLIKAVFSSKFQIGYFGSFSPPVQAKPQPWGGMVALVVLASHRAFQEFLENSSFEFDYHSNKIYISKN